MSLDQKDKALLIELVRGAEKTFENAEALYREASIFREMGFLSRALFLHQISLEECAKIDILSAFAANILSGHEADLAELTKVLSSHARKNDANAYFLVPSAEEEAARRSGDFKGAKEAFSKMQEEFKLKSNFAKNAALYVDFKDDMFVSPNEYITCEMVADIAARNHYFLGLSFPKVELLRKWEQDPEGASEESANFEKRLIELKEKHPSDRQGAMERLLQEMLEARLQKGK